MYNEYLKWSILFHFDSIGKIKSVLDDEINVEGVFRPLTAKLYIITDFDLTLTREDGRTVFEEFYFNQLPRVNKKIEENLNEIKKCIFEIDTSPSNFEKSHKKLNKILKESKLTKSQFLEACVETGRSKNIKIVHYAREAFIELEKMGCVVGINSGSPKTAIEEICKRKIGVDNSNIAGSEFLFDEKGYFSTSSLNLGENKKKSMSEYFLPETYCDLSFLTNSKKPNLIYVTDDLSHFEEPVVAKVGSKLGVTLFVGKDLEKYGNYEYVINAPELREDFRKIKPYLNLYRRAKIFSSLYKPEESEKMIELAEEIKSYDYEDFNYISSKIEDFLSLNVLFPKSVSRIEEKIYELRKKSEINALRKEELREIVELMESFDPLFHVNEKRKEELKKIISSTSP
ncbi:MAG: hypothetical protein QXG39_06660 [Candidatus Aenigmatarchaeota archaeon]